MLTKKLIFILWGLLLLSHPAWAVSGQNLVNGAGTLSNRQVAFSFDLGFDLPEPILYGLRLDMGLGDNFQIGLGGTFFVVLNTLGVNSMYNFWKTENERDFFSVCLNPSLLYSNGDLIGIGSGTDTGGHTMLWFMLRPGLAYEHRLGTEKNMGLYFKLGSTAILGSSRGGEFFAGGFTNNTVSVDFIPGFQVNMSDSFSLTLQAMYSRHVKTRGDSSAQSYGGKVGFSQLF